PLRQRRASRRLARVALRDLPGLQPRRRVALALRRRVTLVLVVAVGIAVAVGCRGLDRCVRPPGGPTAIGPLEGLLRAVLGGRTLAHKSDQGAEDPAIRFAGEAFQVGLRSRHVRLGLGFVRWLVY